MSYARFSKIDSDVYVYDTGDGFICERCPGIGQQFWCATAAEMLTHLLEHRTKGDKVPERALELLRGEASPNR